MTRVFKLTFKDNTTFYGIHSTHKTAESYKKDIFSIAKNNIGKNRSTTAVWRKIFKLELEDFNSELVGTYNSKEDAIKEKASFMNNDPKSINVSTSEGGRLNAKTKSIRISKRDSIKLGGSTYVLASSLSRYPSVKDNYSTADNVSVPGVGRFFKLHSLNVNRI